MVIFPKTARLWQDQGRGGHFTPSNGRWVLIILPAGLSCVAALPRDRDGGSGEHGRNHTAAFTNGQRETARDRAFSSDQTLAGGDVFAAGGLTGTGRANRRPPARHLQNGALHYHAAP
jgi:hypothetical protein